MSDHVTIDLSGREVVPSSGTALETCREASVINTTRSGSVQEHRSKTPGYNLKEDVDDDDTYNSAFDSKGALNRFLYGSKPPWGWDYVLAFKMSKALRQKFGGGNPNPGNPQGRPSDSKEDLDLSEHASDLGPDANGDASAACGPEKCVLQTRKRVEILARLKSAGFSFSQLAVPSEGVILVRISLPEQCLKEKAGKIGLELKLKQKYGGGYLRYSPENENAFVNEETQSDHKCFFSPADRAIIILAVLQSKEHWGCDLDIERLVYDQTVLQVFALHSLPERDELVHRAVWDRLWDPTWKPPLNDLKNYLGARVSFYFVFVSFYARRLLAVSLVSIPVYAVYLALSDYRLICILLWVFSISLVLWTTFFLETWKRRTANMSLRWGLNDYKEETVDDTRPQFSGEMRVGFYCEGGFVSLTDIVQDTMQEGCREPAASGMKLTLLEPILPTTPTTPTTISTSSPVATDYHNVSPHAPQKESGLRTVDLPHNPYKDPRVMQYARLQSVAVTTLFVLIVGGLTFLLLWYRTEISQYFGQQVGRPGIGSYVPGVLNGILITAFDPIWRSVSLTLTRRENHRTNQMFENSLIYKRFAFQFVSNYISLFYIAFLRPYVDKKCTVGFSGTNDCMRELESQLLSLVVTRATIGQAMELFIPFLWSRAQQWHAQRKSDAVLVSAVPKESSTSLRDVASSAHNRYVQESKLAVYDSTMDDYNELVIQFGYMSLFGLAFPPASVVSLLNNLIEVRTDAFKILRLSQRPHADDAADIGAWYYILEFINILSVLTNVGLLVFTADSLNILFDLDGLFGNDVWRKLLHRVVAFFIAEHILLSLKAAAASGIPDVPSKTYRKIARQQFDIARWFDVGWKNAFRGISLLKVDEKQVELCHEYAEVFETASEEGDTDEVTPPLH